MVGWYLKPHASGPVPSRLSSFGSGEVIGYPSLYGPTKCEEQSLLRRLAARTILLRKTFHFMFGMQSIMPIAFSPTQTLFVRLRTYRRTQRYLVGPLLTHSGQIRKGSRMNSIVWERRAFLKQAGKSVGSGIAACDCSRYQPRSSYPGEADKTVREFKVLCAFAGSPERPGFRSHGRWQDQ